MINTNKIPHYQIKVEYDTQEAWDRKPDPADKWDCGNLVRSFTINSFKVLENRYGDFEVSFKPEKEQKYYLLYVLYEVGSSLGSSDEIEFVGLYENMELAEENKKRILDHYDMKRGIKKKPEGYSKYHTYLVDANGNNKQLFVSWTGYFDSLKDVLIESVYLNGFF